MLSTKMPFNIVNQSKFLTNEETKIFPLLIKLCHDHFKQELQIVFVILRRKILFTRNTERRS